MSQVIKTRWQHTHLVGICLLKASLNGLQGREEKEKNRCSVYHDFVSIFISIIQQKACENQSKNEATKKSWIRTLIFFSSFAVRRKVSTIVVYSICCNAFVCEVEEMKGTHFSVHFKVFQRECWNFIFTCVKCYWFHLWSGRGTVKK